MKASRQEKKKEKEALLIPGNKTKIKKKFKMCNICIVRDRVTCVYILKLLIKKSENRSWKRKEELGET